MRNASDLFTELNAVDESIQIEAKRASEIGKSVMQTVIAFANEPGLRGGYLLLGADWKTDEKGDVVYWAHGLADSHKIQRDLASQCASTLNVAVRPEMRMERVDGRAVLVVFVPESDVSQKSVYVKATGLPRGAYRRIGSTDQHCVDEDLWVLRGETQPQTWPDMAVIGDASRDDIDPQAVAEYRRLRVEANAGAEGLAYGDDDLLEAICALRRIKGELKPTIAGVVMFGKALALRPSDRASAKPMSAVPRPPPSTRAKVCRGQPTACASNEGRSWPAGSVRPTASTVATRATAATPRSVA